MPFGICASNNTTPLLRKNLRTKPPFGRDTQAELMSTAWGRAPVARDRLQMEKSSCGTTAGFAIVKSLLSNPPSPSIQIKIARASADANPHQLHWLSTRQLSVPIAPDQAARGCRSQNARDQWDGGRANGLEKTSLDQ